MNRGNRIGNQRIVDSSWRSSVRGVGVLGVAVLVGCGDPTSADGDSTTSATSGTGGAGGGATACKPRTLFGAGQRDRIATHGESVFYVRLGTSETVPPALVRSDLETEEDAILLQQVGLGPFTVLGDDVYVAVGEEIRRIRFDGTSTALVAAVQPGATVTDLVADLGSVTWLETQGEFISLRRRENGATVTLPGDVTHLVGPDAGGVIGTTVQGQLVRIDANGVAPVAAGFVGFAVLVHDGAAYGFKNSNFPVPYFRIELATGAALPLFEAPDYTVLYHRGAVADADRFYALTTNAFDDPDSGAQLLMERYTGGEPTVLAKSSPTQYFGTIASTEKRLVWSVVDANLTSQIRTLCKDTLPP